ncbi:MAG: Na+ dependent nucleoside transporter, partial [Saprospiraceae bacterium]|nr:Na+ dependent nucleoside transporter [Saprospiraceae bacterium]
MEHILRGMLGITVLIGILYLFSANRKHIDWKLVAAALASQLVLGILVLKVDVVQSFFSVLSSFFTTVIDCTQEGTKQVFGEWPQLVGIDSVEFTPNGPKRTETYVGYVFAIQVLPTIIFFSALSAILYYLGILQKIIYGLAWFLSKIMRLTGAESMAAAANVFIGQTEAPLIIKPFLSKMSKSEIMCLMVGGMATIAGGVLAAYIGFLGGNSDAERSKFAMHLLTASIMSAPAAILAAKMLYPETNKELNTQIEIPKEQIGDNLLDAISKGTSDGLRLAVNVGAMLIVFTALMFMMNQITTSTLGSWIPIGDGTLNEYVVTASGGMFEGFTL